MKKLDFGEWVGLIFFAFAVAIAVAFKSYGVGYKEGYEKGEKDQANNAISNGVAEYKMNKYGVLQLEYKK